MRDLEWNRVCVDLVLQSSETRPVFLLAGQGHCVTVRAKLRGKGHQSSCVLVEISLGGVRRL